MYPYGWKNQTKVEKIGMWCLQVMAKMKWSNGPKKIMFRKETESHLDRTYFKDELPLEGRQRLKTCRMKSGITTDSDTE